MCRLTATQRGLVLNGSFYIRRIRAPYPLRPLTALLAQRQMTERSRPSCSPTAACSSAISTIQLIQFERQFLALKQTSQ